MAITSERYIPDRGQVIINTVDQSGSVKTVNYSVPRRTERKVNSQGGDVTIVQDRDKAGIIEVTLEVFDDRSLLESSVSVLKTLWTAYDTNIVLTDMTVAPAGSSVGMAEYTFGTPINVVQCPPHGSMDADTEDEAIASVVIVVDSVSVAAIV